MLREGNAWSIHDFDGRVRLWQTAQGCVRSAYSFASRKIDFLAAVPWLLVRLEEPGVTAECLRQWEEATPERHHPVTREFLDPGQHLRRHVDAMGEDGSRISPELNAAIASLKAIPLDDSIAEEPHARAKRISEAARGAAWPWIASTMRLYQNLIDAHELSQDREDRQWMWTNYKSLLKTGSPRHVARHTRMPRMQYLKKIYAPEHLLG